MAGYLPRRYRPTRPKTVTHPSTNRARRGLISFMRQMPLTSTPGRSIVMTVYVCLSLCVWVSVREHISETTCPIFTILCMLPMAVARSSSGGVAIRYVLPVLWMTSYLRISQGSSTWPPGWPKHNPHAAFDLAINGA